MNRFETLTDSLKKIKPPHLNLSVLPEANLVVSSGIVSLIKEQSGFTSTEIMILKSGLTAIAVGVLLYSEASRRRQMEAADKGTKRLSKAAMVLVTAGTAGVLTFIWKANL